MHASVTIPRDRLEIIELPRAAATHTFADDVRAGLAADKKTLSSKYFYDGLGSALFDAITRLPEYYLTASETEILRTWGWEIVRMLGGTIEFLELGSGSALKTTLLIEEALRVQPGLRYSPIEISLEALRASSSALVERYGALSIRAYAGDYFTVLGSKSLQFDHRVLAMLMGSNLGNYEPAAARDLVALVGRALRPGDGLLLGLDRKKDAETLERAYDDPAGVTAAFDKNILGRINRELNGNFDLRRFEHVAVYDEQRGCVESFLQSKNAQRIRIGALDLDVAFDAGERIHTESSYKFDDAAVDALASATGFTRAKCWSDRGERFSVYLLVRA
jgi:L-histidine N-alpha-methyltransferase